MTAVPKLSYLHVSKLKKRNMNREKLFKFWNLVQLKGSNFHLNDKKISDIGFLTSEPLTWNGLLVLSPRTLKTTYFSCVTAAGFQWPLFLLMGYICMFPTGQLWIPWNSVVPVRFLDYSSVWLVSFCSRSSSLGINNMVGSYLFYCSCKYLFNAPFCLIRRFLDAWL